jgi:hypothetical protein
MNRDVELMLSKPGRYAVSNAGFRSHGRYVLVEVDDDGTCHQLNPRGERDGILGRDGWPLDTRVYVTDARELVFVRLGDPGEVVVS